MSNKKWPKPADCKVAIEVRFVVTCLHRNKYHAEATFAFPVSGKEIQYAHIVEHGPSWASAMRALISTIETSPWYGTMKSQGVYFHTKGEGTDAIYRGYYL